MPFLQEPDMREVDQAYGNYQSTFLSATGQVRVDLFKSGGWLLAYVTFPTGLDADRATDPYVGQLWDYARDHGFDKQLKIFVY